MNPRLILAVIAGGVTGTFTFSLFNAGLVAPPSPGSIFCLHRNGSKRRYAADFQRRNYLYDRFLRSRCLVAKTTKQTESEDLDQAKARMKEMKQAPAAAAAERLDVPVTKSVDNVQKIVFSCDAGMGSSAMGASILRKK